MASKGKQKDTSSASSRSLVKAHIKRKGRHAKKKFSNTKTSKNYKKSYNGQGR